MPANSRHLQLRLSSEMRKEIESASQKLLMTSADVIRGALFFGLPIFTQMAELQKELGERFIKKLKKDSRTRRSS
jgi:hypothetical protein